MTITFPQQHQPVNLPVFRFRRSVSHRTRIRPKARETSGHSDLRDKTCRPNLQIKPDGANFSNFINGSLMEVAQGSGIQRRLLTQTRFKSMATHRRRRLKLLRGAHLALRRDPITAGEGERSQRPGRP
jgi:hypothetical protein